MKLDKQQIGLLLHLVAEDMRRSRKHSIGYNQDLVRLEVILNKAI